MNVDLHALNLQSKWPKLSALQNEIADLERRLHRAHGAVNQAQNQLPHAREQDLADAGKAIRARKAVPKPEHEPKVRAELEAAETLAEQVARALQSAREDLGNFLAVHQGELYRDVLEARDQIGHEVARAAQEAQRCYSRYEALRPALKGLRPAEPANENAPAQRNTYAFAGVHATTWQAGPDQGRVEEILGYLAGLAAEEEGGANSAA